MVRYEYTFDPDTSAYKIFQVGQSQIILAVCQDINVADKFIRALNKAERDEALASKAAEPSLLSAVLKNLFSW